MCCDIYFLSRDTILHIDRSNIRQSFEYCCHIFSGVSIYLHMLDNVQKCVMLFRPD